MVAEFSCFGGPDQIAVIVQQIDFGAGSDIEAGLDDASVCQREADTGIGADQTMPADGDEFPAAAGKCSHGAATTTEIAVLIHHHPGGYTPLNHGRAEGAGIEIDKPLVHDGSAFTDIGAEANACGVGDAYPRGTT